MAHLTTIGHKKLFALIILGLVCTVRCNSPREASKLPSVLDRVKSEGTIRAGYIVYPPFVTKDPNTADLGGLFIDVMAEIARQLGVSITAVQISWAEQRRLLKTREKASPKGCSGDQVAALDKIEIMLLSQLGLHSRQ